MPCFKFSACITLVSVIFDIFFMSFNASAADPTYLYHICPNTTSFTRNTTYFANLRTVLSSLSSPNATYDTGYQNAMAGQTPDMAYGLFLCRGDVSAEVCRDCVVFAANDTLQRCPVEKETVIWYDECMIRYSVQNILAAMRFAPFAYMWNTQNITENQVNQFNQSLAFLMIDAAEAAASSSRKFMTKKANFTVFQTMYSLAQCTPDLTRLDCESCLRQAINQLPVCCEKSVGGRVLASSCNIRYELYPFYNETTAVSEPPPVSAPPQQSPGSSTQPPPERKGKNSAVTIIAVVVPVSICVLLFIAAYCFLARRTRKKSSLETKDSDGDDITSTEPLQFQFSMIESATNKFSPSNKLGHGGFGEVYMGQLPNGQTIAVKRLSQRSAQGAQEFKNEVALVTKLQHRNLVRLLGFCLEGEEKILVYEFVPNKSLDYFLFDPEKRVQLDWWRRYKIIQGIARGVLYLHQDSRLTIIHRDIKASNILLDANLNPKISDFGMARIFGIDQTQANTGRIVGTYGYMSPEYAIHGDYSTKSDVYSFGILVLEIISGKKSSSFYEVDGVGDLVAYAWRLWSEGTPLELLDPSMGRNYQINEAIRCIHISLLCVQDNQVERPMMDNIVLMLNSYSITLPIPQRPGFLLRSTNEAYQQPEASGSDGSTNKSMPWSVDDSSITGLHPR